MLSLEAQIDGVSNQIQLKTAEILSLTSQINRLEPTLDTPYTSLTYSTTDLTWSSDRPLSIPGLLVVSNESVPYAGDNNIELVYLPASGSSSKESTLSVGPYGVIISVNSKYINIHDTGVTYNSSHTVGYPQTVVVPAASTAVIFTETGITTLTMKLLVRAECNGEVQSAEIIVARNSANHVVCSVYGLIYTGLSSFCTFDAQWNSITNKIEVVATNTDPTNNAQVVTQSSELS